MSAIVRETDRCMPFTRSSNQMPQDGIRPSTGRKLEEPIVFLTQPIQPAVEHPHTLLDLVTSPIIMQEHLLCSRRPENKPG